jgi:aspartate 1-decarboxylase
MRVLLRSKLHKGVVTEANLAYMGSLTINLDVLDAVGSDHVATRDAG